MNKGSQPSVNYLCCFSTVAIANRDGTIRGLFIPRVILLTVGNSATVAGRISFSSIASSSLFTNSKLFFHAGTLRNSCPSAVRGFRFQNLGYVSMGPSRFSAHPALQLPRKLNTTRIFHLSKEHCITLSCLQHLLSTPVQRRPMQHAY